MAKATLRSVGDFVRETYDPPNDLSVYKGDDGRIYAVSKAAGISAGVTPEGAGRCSWQENLKKHIDWQLGLSN